ncbi:MAG: hypothetical protein Q7T01_04845 [bacterium]|nr:hypothetical protein [bacterium]
MQSSWPLPPDAMVELSKQEIAAWDARLGVCFDDVSAWGRVVAKHLYGSVERWRRLAHLAHAFRVMPYVPTTPADLFPVDTMADSDYSSRGTQLLEHHGMQELIDELQQPGVLPIEAALRLHAYLDPLALDDRVVVLVVVFQQIDCVPMGIERSLGTCIADHEARWMRIVANREHVLRARAAADRAIAGGGDTVAVMTVILDALDSIDDAADRAIVAGYFLFRMRVEARECIRRVLEHFSVHLVQCGVPQETVDDAEEELWGCDGSEHGQHDDRITKRVTHH